MSSEEDEKDTEEEHRESGHYALSLLCLCFVFALSFALSLLCLCFVFALSFAASQEYALL